MCSTPPPKLHRSLNRLEARKLLLACRWADLHTAISDSTLPGTDQLIRYGGDGTPQVAEFCTAELGAACGESTYRAKLLIGDALDLRHRHPVLWQRVQAGEVKAWVAAQIVRTTRDHPQDIALEVDRLVARYADRKSVGALVRIVEAHLIRLDPDHARQHAERTEKDQGVWVSPSSVHGTREIFIRTTTAAATFFDARINRIADDLKLCGDESPKHIRRATAIGMIGSATLNLSTDPADRIRTQSASKVTLYVHLTDQALSSNTGVARVEGAGPVPVDQIRGWLRHTRVTVKPVIDLNQQTPIDAYEIPDRLREAVHLITPTDCFPHATNTSRHQDIDHTTPFDDTGPPGQTRIGNLGPMTRLHHRTKTHSGWQLKQPFTGIYLWRSPHGRHYLVDHTGTRSLDTEAA